MPVARRSALGLPGNIAGGGDPRLERRRTDAEAATLEQAFQAFLDGRPNLRAKTGYDHGRTMRVAFRDWQSLRLAQVTREKVIRRHAELGERSGQAYANLAMRVLRSVLNFASRE